MSLYDDLGFDPIKEKGDQVAGWSSSIKLLQSQLQLKKTAQTQHGRQGGGGDKPANLKPKREAVRKPGIVLAPVIDLKSRKDDDDSNSNSSFGSYSGKEARNPSQYVAGDPEWHVDGEYDPMWPNDYEKVIKDIRDRKEREREKEEEERRRKHKEERDRRTRERYEEDRRKSGFGGRKESDEEEEERPSRSGGVAIAPPPSLQEAPQESAPSSPPPIHTPPGGKQHFTGDGYGMGMGGSVAAKIMAKYGFKEGQGLGKLEQGISMALQVEKTSKRGGRIISEKDIMPPPAVASPLQPNKQEPSITEMMKNPSKVVLLRNMVGPGEVDEDLEPEVKDECNTKYGDVVKVVIFEMQNVPSDEAVRIFVEFKRIESAIKAVVDLNGRYFGGRQVKAGFYSWEKLNNLELLD